MNDRAAEAKVDLGRFIASLPAKTDAELHDLARQYIWLSAYAANNPRSNFHGKCDAVYDECKHRGKADIYSRAHEQLMREAKGY